MNPLLDVYKSEFQTTNEYSVIEILPKTTPIMHVKITYKMDFWAFIYNFGGIVGLYFGWSAISFSTLFTNKYFTKIYNMIKMILKLMFKIIKYIQKVFCYALFYLKDFFINLFIFFKFYSVYRGL